METKRSRAVPTSTVGRGKRLILDQIAQSKRFCTGGVSLFCGDSLDLYPLWDAPDVIVSDGGYGVLGFEGDTSDHLALPQWYEPHIDAWSESIPDSATLWFWNSEIGWAAVHPVLEKYGWRYVNCNVWNKGKAHIAGNVNTRRIRRFPVVTEVCVQYVKEVRIDGLTLQRWLRREWQRSGLPWKQANTACGVRDAAVRKYFDKGHLWYFPPAEAFEKLARHANEHGAPEGRPYFSRDGVNVLTAGQWKRLRARFRCPHGFTNVWDRPPLKGGERIRSGTTQVAHLNQKPLDLISLIIEASSDSGNVVWEPFGGLFTAALAARRLGRRAFAAEIDPEYFTVGLKRFIRRDGTSFLSAGDRHDHERQPER